MSGSVPPDHRLAGHPDVRLADAADETFILLRPGYGLRDTTETLVRGGQVHAACRLRG